jgi:hypothetical protein
LESVAGREGEDEIATDGSGSDMMQAKRAWRLEEKESKESKVEKMARREVKRAQ